MIQKSGPERQPAEEIIRDIRRTTRRHEKLEGLHDWCNILTAKLKAASPRRRRRSRSDGTRDRSAEGPTPCHCESTPQLR
jgi:hypothetical protein